MQSTTKTSQEIIDDGKAAERLLADPDLVRFLEEMQQGWLFDLPLCDLEDTQRRNDIWLHVRAVELVRDHLKIMVDNATIEIKAKSK